MAVWEVSYDILKPVDRHPIGPRIMCVRAETAENAMRKVAVWYDVALNGEFLQIRRAQIMGPKFETGKPIPKMPR